MDLHKGPWELISPRRLKPRRGPFSPSGRYERNSGNAFISSCEIQIGNEDINNYVYFVESEQVPSFFEHGQEEKNGRIWEKLFN